MAVHPSFPWQDIPDLKSEDQKLLKDIFIRFPLVHKGFLLFTRIDPWQRVKSAARILEQQPRSGYLRFDIPLGFREILSTHSSNPIGRHLLNETTQRVTETVLEH